MIPPRNETAAATPILCISNSDRPKTPELLFAVKLAPAEGTRRSTALADIKEVKANVPKIKKKKKIFTNDCICVLITNVHFFKAWPF